MSSKMTNAKQHHNLANSDDYQFILNQLGGEKFIKGNFSEVYKIIQNTQKQAQSNSSNVRTNAAEKIGEFENSAKIRGISYDTKNVTTASSIHRVEENPQLIIVGQLRDITNNKAIDGFAVSSNNSHYLMGNVSKASASLTKSQDRTLQAQSTFHWIGDNGTLQSYSETSNAIKIYDNTTVVKGIKVEDPDKKKSKKGLNTVIVYGRDYRVGDDYDYNFSNVSSGNNVKIHIPFKGSVEFNTGFIPQKVNIDNFQLQIEHEKFGIAKFNQALLWNNIAWELNENILNWKFPDNWEVLIAKQNFTEGLGFNFYCEMEINVKSNGLTFPIPIVIQSEGEQSEDPSYKKIKPIDIWWGCLGRNTRIRMADGSDKPVQDIQVNEKIKNSNGEIFAVKDIITGHEEQIMFIESNRGNVICVTEEHPVLTTTGMVLAKNLNAANILVMEYGNDEIRSLYSKEYNDTVYSIAFEKESNIVADGFIVGDFMTQQTAKNLCKKQPAKALESFQKEFNELISELNKKMTCEAKL